MTLTIDTKEQRYAQKALQWAMKKVGIKRGVVIAMNPQTGEVLALVSLPTYDNNQFARGISNKDYAKLLNNPDKPLLNHAIQAHYPPGSTYKLVAGTGALADKKITPSTRVRTAGFLTLGGTRFYDWNHRGFGACNIYCGFGHSSDTFFFQMAGKLGIDRLGYWAKQYGFGNLTGIDLPGEVSGIVPTNEWKQSTLGAPIFGGETYQAGIGQGYDVVTPIQLINAYATLANGGTLYQPQIVRDIVGPDGTVVRPFKPKIIHKMKVPANVLRVMRNAARNTVLVRHTYNLVDMPIKVAGKSGTAEFGTRDSKGRLPYHSWFVGFVPKDAKHGSFNSTERPDRRPRPGLRLADEGQRRHRDREVLLPTALRDQEGLPPSRSAQARQLLPEQLMGVIRAQPARINDWAAKSVGAAWRAFDLQLTTYAGLLLGDRPRDGIHEQRRAGTVPLEAGTTFSRGLMWAAIAVVVFVARDGVRLPLAQDARVADLRRPDRTARPHPRDRERRRRARRAGSRSGR